jgi:hypothetical protein
MLSDVPAEPASAPPADPTSRAFTERAPAVVLISLAHTAGVRPALSEGRA